MKGFYYLILFVSVPLSLLADEPTLSAAAGDTMAVNAETNTTIIMSTNSTTNSRKLDIYDPIEPNSTPPKNLIHGAICVQKTQIVGVGAGCMMTYEVIAGRCETGFDGSCDSESCENSVGDTFTAIDPACLIGS